MSVHVEFRCGGCDAKAWGTEPLRVEFRSFSGRGHGFGRVVRSNTVEDITPEGWVAYDPYTYCCYCPECWQSIMEPAEADGKLIGGVDHLGNCVRLEEIDDEEKT